MNQTGPAHGIQGDLDEPTRLPETIVPEQDLTEEKNLAKYSQTKEFKRLKQFMEDRIKFYQHFMPDGTRVEGDPKELVVDERKLVNIKVMIPNNVSPEMMIVHWKAACIIIKEFENVLDTYARAQEIIKEKNGL